MAPLLPPYCRFLRPWNPWHVYSPLRCTITQFTGHINVQERLLLWCAERRAETKTEWSQDNGWWSRKILENSGRQPNPFSIPWVKYFGLTQNYSLTFPTFWGECSWDLMFPPPCLTYSLGLNNLSFINILHSLPYFPLLAVLAKAICRHASSWSWVLAKCAETSRESLETDRDQGRKRSLWITIKLQLLGQERYTCHAGSDNPPSGSHPTASSRVLQSAEQEVFQLGEKCNLWERTNLPV